VTAPAAQRFVAGREHAGMRLDAALAVLVRGQASRSQIARHIGEGAVSVAGEICVSPSRKLRAGEEISWAPAAPRQALRLAAQEIPLAVLFEDPYLIVIDKPPGLVVHPAPGHEEGTLVNALLAHCRDLKGIGGELRPGIVHRLDKDTSGVMVVAKDDRTHQALSEAFKAHRMDRVYEALAAGRPAAPSGRIETLHGRDPRDRKRFTTRVRTGRTAITNWRLIEDLGPASRIEARLETGRTHQVRLHLAGMGCPILGDPVYGRPARDPEVREIAKGLGRQALHARRLGFTHPSTGKELVFETEPPVDHQRALAALRALRGRAG
jgi:23S rRNA pseudouridine1911/1915/1917 synthase